MSVRFNKIDGFIRVYHGTIYLVLFGAEKYDFIYNRVRYVIEVKSVITYVISYNYARIKVDSYDSLLLEETLTFCNDIIHIKLVWNKDKSHYYYNKFLENVCIDYLKITIINWFLYKL